MQCREVVIFIHFTFRKNLKYKAQLLLDMTNWQTTPKVLHCVVQNWPSVMGPRLNTAFDHVIQTGCNVAFGQLDGTYLGLRGGHVFLVAPYSSSDDDQLKGFINMAHGSQHAPQEQIYVLQCQVLDSSSSSCLQPARKGQDLLPQRAELSS